MDTSPEVVDVDADVADVTLVDPAEQAREFPGRVRGQRIEITSHDLKMFSAITGHTPSAEERRRALTWADGDPVHDEINAATDPNAITAGPSTGALSLAAWSPAALSMRLREMWFNGISIRVARPQVSTWLRRLSAAVQQGRRRIEQAGNALARTARNHHLW
jgi:hypothetical protein